PREGSNRLFGGVTRGLGEMESAPECEGRRGDPHDSRGGASSNKEIVGKLELFAGRTIPPLSYDSRLQAALIDVDRGPDRDHRVKALDILVAHAHAAMAHGLPDRFGVISTVDPIAVAELETARSQHAHIPAGGGSVWRNNNVPIHNDLLSFNAPT